MSHPARSARRRRAGSRLTTCLITSLTILASTSVIFGMLPTEIQFRMFPSYVGEERFMRSIYEDRYEWVGSENEIAARESDRREAAVRYVSASR